ncbi:MAG: ribosome biogenesis GTP-binding protein YihA/YsxC [Cyclobacteriaceae bacterium]
MNQIKSASFIKSSSSIDECPEPDLPEYAFIGRSNVGKSSLINMLTQRKQLAKVSGKPGKTQLINHFLIDDTWYLVDLPGYGWAQASKKEIAKWKAFTQDYFKQRANLSCVFVLVDSRLEPQKKDLDFVQYLGENGIPLAFVFTKADKLGVNKSMANMARFRKTLLKTWEALPPFFMTSAENGHGKDELLKYIDEINREITM